MGVRQFVMQCLIGFLNDCEQRLVWFLFGVGIGGVWGWDRWLGFYRDDGILFRGIDWLGLVSIGCQDEWGFGVDGKGFGLGWGFHQFFV